MGGTVAFETPWERPGKVEDWEEKPHKVRKENETQLKSGLHIFIWKVTLLYIRAHLLPRTTT